MSYNHYDQGVPYGIPQYPGEPSRQRPLPPPQGRRAQANAYNPTGAPRGPPPMRPAQGGALNGRYPVRPQQQQYATPSSAPPPPVDSNENLYDGSGFGEPEYEQNDQWPLPAKPFVQPGRSNSPSNNPRRPPQRPQRPDFQPPAAEPPRPAARVAPANKQYHPPPPPLPPPSHHGSGQWTGDGYSSPSANYPPPNGQLSQAQFQQGAYGQANKRPPLGPPPSARRGPASYYPQVAPVHPIVEETDSVRGSIRNGSLGAHDSMRSYASSNAIPIGIPDYYLEQRDSMPSVPGADPMSESEYDYDESPIDPPTGGRDSRFEDREEPSPEPAALVRQASLGRKSKPTLTTVKSGDRMRKESASAALSSLPSQQRTATGPTEPPPAMAKDLGFAKETGVAPSDSETDSYRDARPEKHRNDDKALEAGGAAALAAAAVSAPALAHTKKSKDNLSQRSRTSDPLASGTGLLDPSSSESEREVRGKPSKEMLAPPMPALQPQRSRERSPLAKEVDPRMTEILGGLEKGGAISPRETERLKAPGGGLSDRAGKRRPPRLNVDAVKEAEARGSLTSLPDLIKRATRLASNLDRGKTASRLGMNWFDGMEEGGEKHRSGGTNSDNRRSGSISDILASFPPPGLATPPGSRGEMRRSFTNWSSNLRHSHLPSDSDGGEKLKHQRRCCGMPLWVFLLLLVALVLLIAAAIIVPVVLIVIPRQEHANSNSNSAVSACQQKLTCQNGGTNIITSSGSCQCLCVNGYTGSTCGTASGAGCTTVNVGSTSDATVGDSIPRLLSGAQSNFSVPLNGQTLLGLFSGADMSCSSENALVTFNNNTGAKRAIDEQIMGLQPTATVQKRQTATSSSDGEATSNGIVYETGSPSIPSASSSTTASAASSTGSSSSSSGSGTSVDFARVAVLYVLQASGQLDDAITAQGNLQSYFTSGKTTSGQSINAANVSLGNGYTCNLNGYSIDLGNGTTVGQSSSS